MKTSESIKSIAKSLNEVRKNIKQPAKNADNPFFKSKYVMLEGVVEAIDKALPSGFSYTQEVTSDGNQVSVSTILLHESGEYIQFDPLTVPVTKNDAQAFGSAETYARRYTLSAVFGVTSDVDDDGNQASKTAPKQQPRRRQPVKSATPLATKQQKEALKSKFVSLAKTMNTTPKELSAKVLAKTKSHAWDKLTEADYQAIDKELSVEYMEFQQAQKKTAKGDPKDQQPTDDELFDALNA